MSPRYLSDRLAGFRDDTQRLIQKTGDHEVRLDSLIALAERDERQAEAAVSRAASADVAEVRDLLAAQVYRCAQAVANAKRLCSSAHRQHAAARRLLKRLRGARAPATLSPNAVLVVDDYGDIRDLLAHVLQEAGFVVETAANGLEALIAAHEMRPGVIVMDVTMPVLDGIEATRLIKAAEATREARVIAYTGNPSFEDNSARTLFAAVLKKPSTPGVVLATVQQVVAGL